MKDKKNNRFLNFLLALFAVALSFFAIIGLFLTLIGIGYDGYKVQIGLPLLGFSCASFYLSGVYFLKASGKSHSFIYEGAGWLIESISIVFIIIYYLQHP
jgi:hypothetical protein